MTAKDQILDFLNLAFALLLIVFSILYFIVENNFPLFASIIKFLALIAVFSGVFLIKLKYLRREIKKRKEENNQEIILALGKFDKLLADIINFLTPVIILGLNYFLNQSISAVDIACAVFVALVFYFWNKHIFSREGIS